MKSNYVLCCYHMFVLCCYHMFGDHTRNATHIWSWEVRVPPSQNVPEAQREEISWLYLYYKAVKDLEQVTNCSYCGKTNLEVIWKFKNHCNFWRLKLQEAVRSKVKRLDWKQQFVLGVTQIRSEYQSDPDTATSSDSAFNTITWLMRSHHVWITYKTCYTS